MADDKKLSITINGVLPDGLSISLAFKDGFKPVAVWDAYTGAIADAIKDVPEEHRQILFGEARNIFAYHWKRRDKRR